MVVFWRQKTHTGRSEMWLAPKFCWLQESRWLHASTMLTASVRPRRDYQVSLALLGAVQTTWHECLLSLSICLCSSWKYKCQLAYSFSRHKSRVCAWCDTSSINKVRYGCLLVSAVSLKAPAMGYRKPVTLLVAVVWWHVRYWKNCWMVRRSS